METAERPIEELIEAKEAIEQILNVGYFQSGKLIYGLSKNKRLIEQALSDYESTKDRLIEQGARRNEDGKRLFLTMDGSYVVQNEDGKLVYADEDGNPKPRAFYVTERDHQEQRIVQGQQMSIADFKLNSLSRLWEDESYKGELEELQEGTVEVQEHVLRADLAFDEDKINSKARVDLSPIMHLFDDFREGGHPADELEEEAEVAEAA